MTQYVRVTFVIEADDPEHETGVTEDTYNKVNDAVLNVGGMDVDIRLEAHDPLGGVDPGPCAAFAPDTLGDDPNICTTCFWHRIDHAMDAGGIGHPLS